VYCQDLICSGHSRIYCTAEEVNKRRRKEEVIVVVNRVGLIRLRILLQTRSLAE
jgi:hypothetical protein